VIARSRLCESTPADLYASIHSNELTQRMARATIRTRSWIGQSTTSGGGRVAPAAQIFALGVLPAEAPVEQARATS
jgi:hypothetical protein